MKPYIVKKITPEIALEMMNSIVAIHNNLLHEDQRMAFFELGSLVEQLAQRVREDGKI